MLGVKTSGTLREIKIFRTQTISTVDLYDYITGNRLNSDVRLSNNDIVFVGLEFQALNQLGKLKTSQYLK